MFEAATRWIREKYKALSTPVAAPAAVDETSQTFDEAFDEFADFFGKITNNLKENVYLQKFNDLGESFRKSGYLAGHWGVREKDIEGMAELQVLITKSQIEEKCWSEQRLLKSQVEILKKIKNNADRDYKTKNTYYERLNRAYQYSHRQFSVLLGFVYGFFSIVLILADIPLALELTKRGFNLKSDPNNPISDLFQYGTNEGFLLHFFKVLTANWEVALFAIGIAFCTIYIKIFYDDFIGVPLENLIKKSSESPIADYEELHYDDEEHYASEVGSLEFQEISLAKREEVTRRFNRLWWWRFSVKCAVLMILLSSIVVLGYFRYSVTVAEDVKAIPATVTFLTYSLLTLLFPIISGICGSLSLNCFHNSREIGKAEREKKQAQKEVENATDNFRKQKEEKERNSGFLKWLDTEDNINQMKNYMKYCYESGYKFGYLYPEWVFGGDLVTRAEALRQRNLVNTTDPLNGRQIFDIKQTPLN